MHRSAFLDDTRFAVRCLDAEIAALGAGAPPPAELHVFVNSADPDDQEQGYRFDSVAAAAVALPFLNGRNFGYTVRCNSLYRDETHVGGP